MGKARDFGVRTGRLVWRLLGLLLQVLGSLRVLVLVNLKLLDLLHSRIADTHGLGGIVTIPCLDGLGHDALSCLDLGNRVSNSGINARDRVGHRCLLNVEHALLERLVPLPQEVELGLVSLNCLLSTRCAICFLFATLAA